MLFAYICPQCGGALEKREERYKCNFCDTYFEEGKIERFTQILEKTLNEEKQEKLAQLKKRLWEETHKKYIDSDSIIEISQQILSIQADDYVARFFYLINKNSAETIEFLNKFDFKTYGYATEWIIDFTIKSLEPNYVLPITDLIEKRFKNSDLTKYYDYSSRLSREAEKIEDGIYSTALPRDVFLCYASADMSQVLELTKAFEDEGISCFVAARNLRHGAGAVQNYDQALKEAMDNSKILVFLSSNNSRKISCDALRIELPYVKNTDVLRAPVEYTHDYAKMPATYKKPRIEYLLTPYENKISEKITKEFFQGFEWCYTKESVLERVMDILTNGWYPLDAQRQTTSNITQINTISTDNIVTKEDQQNQEQKLAEERKRIEEEQKKIAEEKAKLKEKQIKIEEDAKRKEEQLKLEKDRLFLEEERKRLQNEQKKLEEEKIKISKSQKEKEEALNSVGNASQDLTVATKEGAQKNENKQQESKQQESKQQVNVLKPSAKFWNNDSTLKRDGSYVYFGCYPQDLKSTNVNITSNKDSNGLYIGSDNERYFLSKEKYYKVSPIKWKILEESNGDALLLSEFLLDSLNFDHSSNNYENSDLRKWLNGEFYDAVFNAEQKQRIYRTALDNSAPSTNPANDPKYWDRGKNPYVCPNTQDNIFLLSIKEATSPKYGFNAEPEIEDKARQKIATNFATDKGKALYWWSRSPVSQTGDTTAAIHPDGRADRALQVMGDFGVGIAPALWIRLGTNNNAYNTVKNMTGRPILSPLTKIKTTRLNGFETANGALIKYYGDENDVKIPSNITKISEGAFAENNELCSVDIGENVTIIEKDAFIGCENLESAIIHNKLTAIGESAFEGCTSLRNISLPKSLKTISDSAFYGCKDLYDIVIPDSVSTIGEFAFQECENLTNVDLPNSLKEIPREAFSKCSSLGNIKLPNGLVSIGAASFSESGVYNIVLPAGLKNIGNNAFSECMNLSSIYIPSTVETIKAGAFEYCYSLKSIFMPPKMDAIQKHAFGSCSELEQIVIPDGVKIIEESTFEDCDNLHMVTIPESVKKISSHAFDNCSELKQIVFNGTNDQWICIDKEPDWDKSAKGYEVINKDGEKIPDIEKINIKDCIIKDDVLVKYTGKQQAIKLFLGFNKIGDNAFAGNTLHYVDIGDNVTAIGKNAFAKCENLNTLILGDNLTEIGDNAFEKCISLTNVTLTNKITTIKESAFNGCSKLQEISIPDGVSVINTKTFADCESLKTVTIPVSVKKISSLAFSNCKELKTIKFNGTYKDWYNVEKALDYDQNAGRYLVFNKNKEIMPDVEKAEPNDFIIENGILIKYLGNQQGVKIPANVTTIGAKAFETSETLHIVVIGKNVTTIQRKAFARCKNLAIVILNDKLTAIEDYAFNKCEALSEIELPETLKKIGENAFFGCNHLTKLIIPDSVDSIGVSAFEGCRELQEIVLPKNLTEIPDRAFTGCDLSSLTIPSRVTTIGESAFEGTLIKRITLPIGLKSIGIRAFFECNYLDNVDLPDTVETIDEAAFMWCSSLKYINLPLNITSIKSSAFSGCNKLTEIYLPDGLTELASSIFSECKNLTSVTIPSSVKKISSYAFEKCESLQNIKFYGTKQQWKNVEKEDYWNLNAGYYVVLDNDNKKIDKLSKKEKKKMPESRDDCLFTTYKPNKSKKNISKIKIQKTTTTKPSSQKISTTPIDKPKTNTTTLPQKPDFIIKDGTLLRYCGLAYEKVEIPESVKRIAENAFRCRSCYSVVIPNSVTYIGSNAFNETKLKTIEFKGSKDEWYAINKASHWDEGTGDYVIKCKLGTIKKGETMPNKKTSDKPIGNKNAKNISHKYKIR